MLKLNYTEVGLYMERVMTLPEKSERTLQPFLLSLPSRFSKKSCSTLLTLCSMLYYVCSMKNETKELTNDS